MKGAPGKTPGNGESRVAGRVVARFGHRYLVALDGAARPAPEVDAIARGRRLEIVVGDRVACSSEHGVHVIEQVEARRTLLFRADAAHTKPLAANVDQVAIVFAAQPTPQPEFVWRALLAARAAGIDALAILNKIDLECAAPLAALAAIEQLGARVLRVSAKTDAQGTRRCLEAQCQGRVTLFVGQSGMGKSSLLKLLVEADLRTGALSRHGTHGRQTTTATRWYAYGSDGAVIDSPGFHEFGLGHLPTAELASWMPDFAAFAAQCRFANCRHVGEPDCAVRTAVEQNAISPARYDFYRRLLAQEITASARSRG